MIARPSPILPALALLALAACGRGSNDERDRAAGEILPGSASDAMLQTDRLQSEAPLARPDAAEKSGRPSAPGGKQAAARPAEAKPSGELTPTPEAAPAPEPEPAPAPTP